MSRSRTLGQLRNDVRQRADLVSSSYITDGELNEYINQSATDLYDELVSARGQPYYQKKVTFVTVGGQENYALDTIAPDFYQLIQMECQLGSYAVPMDPYMAWEHGRYTQLPITGGNTIGMYYVPALARMTVDGDTFDGVNGWEEWIILDVCIKCRAKEETDAQVFMAQLERQQKRIEAMKTERDMGNPERIQDVYRSIWRLPILEPVPKYRLTGTNLSLVQGLLPRGMV